MNTDLPALCTYVLGLSCDGHGLDGEEKLMKLRNIQPPSQDGLWGRGENVATVKMSISTCTSCFFIGRVGG